MPTKAGENVAEAETWAKADAVGGMTLKQKSPPTDATAGIRP